MNFGSNFTVRSKEKEESNRDFLLFPKHNTTSITMKKIEAIVRLSRFDKVRDALAQVGVNFFTLKDVKGFGLQKGQKMVYRGSVYDSDYIARLQIDILTTDDKVDLVVDTIVSSARTGEVGDGKVMVYDIESVTRIRNSDKNADAI